MTEYKKNDNGIWLPIDKINLQNNKKVVPNIRKPVFNVVGNITKITAFFTIIGILIGNFNIYNYLKYINYDFLFPDIISNTSSAIAILLMYSLFILTLMLGFLSPFLLNAFISYKGYKNLHKEYLYNIYKVSILFAFFNIVIFALCLKFDFNYKYVAGVFSFIFMYLAMGFLTQRKDNILTVFLLSLIIPSPTFIYFIFVLLPTILTTNNKDFHWLFFATSTFLFLYNFIASYICLIKKQYSDLLISLLFLLIIIYNFFLSMFQDYSVSLYKTKFIEKPQDSSWYLIHNGNTNSNTVNGLNQTDIIQAKDIFNAQNCDGLTDKVQENCKNDNKQIFNQRQNALYGYMAWNLGNTKVFCPVSVDFFNFTENEKKLLNYAEKDKKDISKEKSAILAKKSKKCLVIDSKHLQLVSGYYLSKPK